MRLRDHTAAAKASTTSHQNLQYLPNGACALEFLPRHCTVVRPSTNRDTMAVLFQRESERGVQTIPTWQPSFALQMMLLLSVEGIVATNRALRDS